MAQQSAQRFRVQGDVTMAYRIVFNELIDATPNAPLRIRFRRGEETSGMSSVIQTDPRGYAVVDYKTGFVATLKQKNETSFKPKPLRIFVQDVSTGQLDLDSQFDLSKGVEDRGRGPMIPVRKLSLFGGNNQFRITLTILAICTEELTRPATPPPEIELDETTERTDDDEPDTLNHPEKLIVRAQSVDGSSESALGPLEIARRMAAQRAEHCLCEEEERRKRVEAEASSWEDLMGDNETGIARIILRDLAQLESETRSKIAEAELAFWPCAVEQKALHRMEVLKKEEEQTEMRGWIRELERRLCPQMEIEQQTARDELLVDEDNNRTHLKTCQTTDIQSVQRQEENRLRNESRLRERQMMINRMSVANMEKTARLTLSDEEARDRRLVARGAEEEVAQLQSLNRSADLRKRLVERRQLGLRTLEHPTVSSIRKRRDFQDPIVPSPRSVSPFNTVIPTGHYEQPTISITGKYNSSPSRSTTPVRCCRIAEELLVQPIAEDGLSASRSQRSTVTQQSIQRLYSTTTASIRAKGAPPVDPREFSGCLWTCTKIRREVTRTQTNSSQAWDSSADSRPLTREDQFHPNYPLPQKKPPKPQHFC